MPPPLAPSHYQRPPPESSFSPGMLVTLLRGLIFLAVLGGCGWAYYYFSWQYRLPQERVLTDQTGHEMQVRLDSRADDAVRFTLLSDGTTHYYPISQLETGDQEFARQLPVNFTMGVPLDYVLTDKQGKAQPVRIEARSDDWVKYSTPDDPVPHYSSIPTLSPVDQALVLTLPPTLTFEYPLDYTLTDAQGHATGVRILGHSADTVNYVVLPDGKPQARAIAELSSPDQLFVRALPSYFMAMEYPVDRTLTDTQGNRMEAHILARNAAIVKFTLKDNGSTQYFPMSSLSDSDQRFLSLLPANLDLHFPMEYTLTDQAGKSIAARIDAASAQLLKLTTLTDGATRYFPIALLCDSDQKLIALMPQIRMNLDYPVLCSLADQNGRVLAVSILGRSGTDVKFTMMVDGSTHSYPLAKLGQADQLFVKTLPMNLGSLEAAGGPQLTEVDSAVTQNLLDRISTLKNDDTNLSVEIADPSTSPNDRQLSEEKLKTNKDEIRSLQQELSAAQQNGGAPP